MAGPVRSSMRTTFGGSLCLLIAILLPLICVYLRYGEPGNYSQHIQQYLTWFQAVEIVCLLGFGFLYAFLRRYSLSALGLTYLLSCIVMVEAALVVGAFQQMVWRGANRIHLELPLMIDAAFCAAGALIWLGGVLGKASPTQLLWLTVPYVPLYAVNHHLVFKTLGALDVGGSISLHAFAAYYGLAASLVISRKQRGAGSSNPLFRGSYATDTVAWVGVLLIWVYWPSFNSALASVPTETGEATPPQPPQVLAGQFLIVINTWLSLLGATLATFATSALVEGRLDVVQVQNASLAGGVIVGSSCNLDLAPGGALGLGLAAGLVSTLGYSKLSPWLEHKFGLTDTCGIHNLHALPGVLGGVAAGIAAWSQSYVLLEHGNSQLAWQLLAILVSFVIGAGGGALGGVAVTALNRQPLEEVELFNDGSVWLHVEADPHAQWQEKDGESPA